MRRAGPVRVAYALLAGLVMAMTSGPGVAGPSLRQVPVVGVPGCADDVAVQASRELITFESRDRPVRAYLYTPRGPANGLGVVLLHGGTGFEMNSILFDAHAIQLASRGYSVILPAYFDTAAPDRTRPLVTARAWRQAARDAASRLTAAPGMSPDGVTLWGYSRGAMVALMAATEEGSPLTSAVLVAGGGAFDGNLAERDIGVLLLHARRDEAAPVRTTRRLADSLRDAGASVEIEELAFDGHQYDLATWCTVFSRTRAFITARSGR